MGPWLAFRSVSFIIFLISLFCVLPGEMAYGKAHLTASHLTASWYGPGFHGKTTASGEKYDMDAFTCAHKSLPFGTVLRVTSVATGKSVYVTVTDRGPFVGGRSLDLSYGAAKEIDLIGQGIGKLKVRRIGRAVRHAINHTRRAGFIIGPFAFIGTSPRVSAFSEPNNKDGHIANQRLEGSVLCRDEGSAQSITDGDVYRPRRRSTRKMTYFHHPMRGSEGSCVV